MSNEKLGKVLFVDDDEAIREVLTRHARLSDVEDFEVLKDATSAVARLKELDETAAAIFCDGLDGGWREVIAAAKAARVPAVVISGDYRLQQDVEEVGVMFLDKTQIYLGFIDATLAELQPPSDA